MKNFIDNVVVLFSWVKENLKKTLALFGLLFTLGVWGFFSVPVVWDCAWADYNLGATDTTYLVFTNKCMAIAGYDEEGNPKLRDVSKMLGITDDGGDDAVEDTDAE